MNEMIIQIVLFLAIIILLEISQITINRVYNKYASMEASLPQTGEQTVRNMLSSNGINDVEIGYISGRLNDHYNSKNKTINLSKNSLTNSISAIAVAAHETGHAMQDHKGYAMLRLRKFLAPVCSFASKLVWVFIFAGIILQFFDLITIGLILMGVTIVFQLVTLPVEFDASRRAIAYLGTLGYDEYSMYGFKKVLKAAAFTYVAGTLASIMQLIRLLLNVRSRD